MKEFSIFYFKERFKITYEEKKKSSYHLNILFFIYF